jgi:hypothetical protein
MEYTEEEIHGLAIGVSVEARWRQVGECKVETVKVKQGSRDIVG